MLNGNKFYELPTYLTQNELNEVCAYLQGAVYVWCCIKKQKNLPQKILLAEQIIIGKEHLYIKYINIMNQMEVKILKVKLQKMLESF